MLPRTKEYPSSIPPILLFDVILTQLTRALMQTLGVHDQNLLAEFDTLPSLARHSLFDLTIQSALVKYSWSKKGAGSPSAQSSPAFAIALQGVMLMSLDWH